MKEVNKQLENLLKNWIPNLNEYLSEYPFEKNMAFAYIKDDVESLLKEAFELGKNDND